MKAAEMQPDVSPRVGVEAAYFEGPAAKDGTAVPGQSSLSTTPFTVHIPLVDDLQKLEDSTFFTEALFVV